MKIHHYFHFSHIEIQIDSLNTLYMSMVLVPDVIQAHAELCKSDEDIFFELKITFNTFYWVQDYLARATGPVSCAF